MKKALLVAAASFVLIPAAHAQDKYGSTYQHQETTPSTATTNPDTFYRNNNSATTPSTMQDDTYSPLSGLYLGAEGGYGWSHLSSAAGDVDPEGMNYGLFGGYKLDHLIQSTTGTGMTAAIEGHYDWSSADDDIAGATIEKDHEWGVDFRPGISINQTFNPYAIIGYERAQFKGTAGGLTGKEDYNGFVLGAGTELVSWDRVGLRTDYTHTWYNEKNGVDPDEDEIKLGLAYHFQ